MLFLHGQRVYRSGRAGEANSRTLFSSLMSVHVRLFLHSYSGTVGVSPRKVGRKIRDTPSVPKLKVI
jgi:hypothetical protein